MIGSVDLTGKEQKPKLALSNKLVIQVFLTQLITANR